MRDKIIEGNYETGLMAGILLKLHGLVVYAPAGHSERWSIDGSAADGECRSS